MFTFLVYSNILSFWSRIILNIFIYLFFTFFSVIRETVMEQKWHFSVGFSMFLTSKPLSLALLFSLIKLRHRQTWEPQKDRRCSSPCERIREDNRSVNALLDIYIDNEVWHGPTQPARFGPFIDQFFVFMFLKE